MNEVLHKAGRQVVRTGPPKKSFRHAWLGDQLAVQTGCGAGVNPMLLTLGWAIVF